jgi:hypothetical protein
MRLFLLGCLCAVPAIAPAPASAVSVGIDMASPVRLQRPVASVIVGNPSIADVQVSSPTLVFLQGRSFGTTNLIALDADGKEILNVPVTVTSTRAFDVTLERGVAGRVTYACAGRCELAVMPGDDPERVKGVLDTSSAKSGAADAVAKGN